MGRASLLRLAAAMVLTGLVSPQVAVAARATPPLPVLPIPTAAQLAWQRREVIMFFHFGMNTFTNSELGTGAEDPALFAPAALNASQWMDAAAAAGASLAILVAKHHDGFCLWPSVDAGLYLSPWDLHDQEYGREVAYNEYYLAQLHELLTGYGSLSEIWFDGHKDKNATNMTYHFQEWFQTVRQLQSSSIIFSDAGPDVRWVGNEDGFVGTTCWSTVNRSMITIGATGIENYLNNGDPWGTDWVPPECDVTIRPGWFWHENETAKTLSQLLDIYYTSVGRNCVLLLNAPPNTTGLVEDADIARLREFRAAITRIFGTDLADGSTARASSERGGDFAAGNVLDGRDDTYWAPMAEDGRRDGYWVELRRPARARARPFNVVRIQEHVALGQRVERHEVYVDGVAVASGTTVGHKRLHRLAGPVVGRTVKIWFAARRGPPVVSAVGLHLDPHEINRPSQ
ncbi:unnamed protein product [Triticum turgidum subsp. durum]|uniref:alpha-L-fucosidase n=1 Tax=Triticum turgidum subsp. durum TaxID=4567 RepID=A0A9R1ANY8_TRITD|nr:unnamed protein product [Triticum turgidum subsp. durum]